MKKIFKISIIYSIIAVITSCIKEDISNCPDYGKYPLIIKDSNQLSYNKQMNSLIFIYNNNERYLFTKEANCSIINGYKQLKLYPGSYKINTLISNKSLQMVDSTKIRVRIGDILFNKITQTDIIKSKENIQVINSKLINSIIDIIADTSTLYKHNYKLISIGISTAEDNNTYYNLINNKINTSSTLYPYHQFYNTKKMKDGASYRLYTIPLEANCPIDIKCSITSRDNIYINNTDIKDIVGRVYINREISSGYCCTIYINIYPNEIIHTKTEIEDWDNITDNMDIILE